MTKAPQRLVEPRDRTAQVAQERRREPHLAEVGAGQIGKHAHNVPRAAGAFYPSAGLIRFRPHDTWHGQAGIHPFQMPQALNLQIDDIRILVDVCNLEYILFVPRSQNAEILIAVTEKRLELALESEELGGNSLNHLVLEPRGIAVEKVDLFSG